MKKLSQLWSALPKYTNQSPSLQQILSAFSQFPDAQYTLIFTATSIKYVNGHPSTGKSSHRGKFGKLRTNMNNESIKKQSLTLFSKTLLKMQNSGKYESSKWGNQQSLNKNDSQRQSKVQYESSGSKSPLKRRVKQGRMLNEQEPNHPNNAPKLYEKSTKTPDVNISDLPISSVAGKKSVKNTEESVIKDIKRLSINEDIGNFKKISSEIFKNNELQLSFNNLQQFIEDKFADSNQNARSKQIQKVSSKNKKSIIESLGQQKILEQQQLDINKTQHNSSLKKINQFKETLSGNKQECKVQKEFGSSIENPYAKHAAGKQIVIKEKTTNQKIAKDQVITKLTDEQVCQIISSRKRNEPNKQPCIKSEKEELRQILDMSDFDIDALLKIQNRKPHCQQKQQTRVNNDKKQDKAGENVIKISVIAPATNEPANQSTKQLQSSFVPHYFLNESQKPNQTSLRTSSTNMELTAVIPKTTVESRIYEIRRLSEQSDQPSSVVLQLSANSSEGPFSHVN